MKINRTNTEERENRRQVADAEKECGRLYSLYQQAIERSDPQGARLWFEHWEAQCARTERIKI